MTFNSNSAATLTQLLRGVKAPHTLNLISARVRMPAPSGQEMDGNAGILSRVELQCLIYFGIRP